MAPKINRIYQVLMFLDCSGLFEERHLRKSHYLLLASGKLSFSAAMKILVLGNLLRRDSSHSRIKGLFTWSGGPRSSGVGFFCFHALENTKQKKPTPLDRGPPLHVNRVLVFIYIPTWQTSRDNVIHASLKILNKLPTLRVFIAAENGWLEVLELVSLFFLKTGTCDAKNLRFFRRCYILLC